MFDLSEISYIKRITVGSTNPELQRHPNEIEMQMEVVNRCLRETPKGKILAMERNFSLLNINEHQVVLQSITYHIGFTRKPAWLEV